MAPRKTETHSHVSAARRPQTPQGLSRCRRPHWQGLRAPRCWSSARKAQVSASGPRNFRVQLSLCTESYPQYDSCAGPVACLAGYILLGHCQPAGLSCIQCRTCRLSDLLPGLPMQVYLWTTKELEELREGLTGGLTLPFRGWAGEGWKLNLL